MTNKNQCTCSCVACLNRDCASCTCETCSCSNCNC